jgi:hypothetical protein
MSAVPVIPVFVMYAYLSGHAFYGSTRLKTGVVGSNHTRGMNVCLCSV